MRTSRPPGAFLPPLFWRLPDTRDPEQPLRPLHLPLCLLCLVLALVHLQSAVMTVGRPGAFLPPSRWLSYQMPRLLSAALPRLLQLLWCKPSAGLATRPPYLLHTSLPRPPSLDATLFDPPPPPHPPTPFCCPCRTPSAASSTGAAPSPRCAWRTTATPAAPAALPTSSLRRCGPGTGPRSLGRVRAGCWQGRVGHGGLPHKPALGRCLARGRRGNTSGSRVEAESSTPACVVRRRRAQRGAGRQPTQHNLSLGPAPRARRSTPLPVWLPRVVQVEGAAKAIQKSGESLLDREVYIESTTERQQRECAAGLAG